MGSKVLPVNNQQRIPIVIITGVPRSGTSILGKVLDRHPRISTWVEPYYVWDYHFRDAPHDQLTADDATDRVRDWICSAFTKFHKTRNADIVADKSPRLCLKIPFVRKVFPEARFIFIIRDGRDTILSMWRQWERKKKIFGESDKGNQLQNRLYVLKRWLGRRPTWQFRIQSILFELGPPRNWLRKKFLNKIRWEGRFGWGPRFEGWQDIIDRTTPLEFSAYQWVHCARGIISNLKALPEDRKFILKYEDFINDPNTSIDRLLAFLHLDLPEHYLANIPKILSDNTNKWQQTFSPEDLHRIGPIIGKTLIEFGYESNESWYSRPDQ